MVFLSLFCPLAYNVRDILLKTCILYLYKDIVNNSEDNEFREESNQSYDSEMSSEYVSRPISFESEEDNYSDDEETESDIQHSTGMKAGTKQPCFFFFGSQA